MGAPATVLTIEDEAGVRSSIAAYLEDSGFEILQARDGLSGIDIFRRQRPDLVLCDLRIPGMDGLEVLSRVTEESPETPVIVVSGASRLHYAVQALKCGAWDYVVKPILDMEVLEGAVRRALERAAIIRQNREYREHLETLNRELRDSLERLREDVKAGRNVQSQLLPPDGLLLGEYRLARRLFPSLYLSGDFVDYFDLDERHFGFYMADISGHGAASAFVTVMVRTLVTQYREAYLKRGDETILHPAAMLQRLNADLCRQELDRYLTLVYGVVDRQQSCLRLCNGGQFPYPILHDGEHTRMLPFPGRPVGLFADALFEERALSLPDSCTLLLVSDGVMDLLPLPGARDRHASLQEHYTAYCHQIIDARLSIDEIVERFGVNESSHLADDVTFLLINRSSQHE